MRKIKTSLEKLRYLDRSSIKNKIVIEVYFSTNKSLEPDSLGCFLRKWGSEWLGCSALAPGCVTLGQHMHCKEYGISVSGLGLAERHHRPHPHPSHPVLAHGQSPPSPTPRAAGLPVRPRQQGQAEGVSEVPRDPGLQGSFFNVPEREWPPTKVPSSFSRCPPPLPIPTSLNKWLAHPNAISCQP